MLDLGKGPFDKSVGTVTKFDRHAHTLTVKDDSGIEATFRIGANTVGDMTAGAVQGFKYEVAKGEKVRVTATAGNGGGCAADCSGGVTLHGWCGARSRSPGAKEDAENGLSFVGRGQKAYPRG